MLFHFKGTYYNEDTGHVDKEDGLMVAETYGAAAEKLINYYGEDSLIAMSLCEWMDIITREEVLEGFEEEE